MYKNPLPIPSRALAVAVAAEWEQQVNTIDMRQMQLNTMLAKAVKCSYDPTLVDYMSKEIVKIIDNDQICFIEPESENEYKAKLRKIQLEKAQGLLDIVKDNFGVELKLFKEENSMFASQSPDALQVINNVIDELDLWTLNSIFQVTVSSKSSAVAMSLIHGHLSIKDAV